MQILEMPNNTVKAEGSRTRLGTSSGQTGRTSWPALCLCRGDINATSVPDTSSPIRIQGGEVVRKPGPLKAFALLSLNL